VSIAVNGKQVRSSGHHGVVSGVMSVMRNACTSVKLRECSEETSCNKVSQGACERACRNSEARRGGLGSNGESEKRPEVDREVRGGRTGSAERVCDTGLQTRLCADPRPASS
jgi:hypothetical protein